MSTSTVSTILMFSLRSRINHSRKQSQFRIPNGGSDKNHHVRSPEFAECKPRKDDADREAAAVDDVAVDVGDGDDGDGDGDADRGSSDESRCNHDDVRGAGENMRKWHLH